MTGGQAVAEILLALFALGYTILAIADGRRR